ncbi:HD superfamily phosphohydrolase [Halapricum desulfuricans]|uniref:HD superfamily phosphohydrolase n=1 Tax=Halapricum desulfuricans TaxID=2841257 RepID=A0A897NIV6_9EURY|nr:hypothetical protein [Halapricum desulfuricans]QSG10819.1 HD superfamily phosphohydrolase [Halapricum desulfuricans]
MKYLGVDRRLSSEQADHLCSMPPNPRSMRTIKDSVHEYIEVEGVARDLLDAAAL